MTGCAVLGQRSSVSGPRSSVTGVVGLSAATGSRQAVEIPDTVGSCRWAVVGRR